MKKLHNVLLASALGAGSLLGAAVPASAAHVYVGTARPAATGRVVAGNRYVAGGRYYGTRYRAYPYRYGYAYPYGYGVGVSVGYGYGGGGYGYAPYPAVYRRRAYVAPRPYWRPYRRVYGRRFVR